MTRSTRTPAEDACRAVEHAVEVLRDPTLPDHMTRVEAALHHAQLRWSEALVRAVEHTPADPVSEGAAMTDQAWLGLTDDDGYRIQKRLHALLAAGWSSDRVADLLKSAYDHDIASSCGYMQGVREAERDFRPPSPKPSRWKRLRRRLRR